MHEQDTDTEPAHHARRPMNAFLIFCKRHRSVVREKYPNLENRSITKILGEWWANLDKEEKACYTGLAKQYKDAFFSANPDFKWYKLPAPPLRTLSSRPREPSEKAKSPTNELYHEIEPEKVNNNSTKVDFNKKPRDGFESESFPYSKPLSMFTPGKLADEAQMGGLSRLLDAKTDAQTPNPYYSPFKFAAISTPNEYRSHAILMNGPSRDEELQNALSETTRVFEDFDENKKVYRYEPANDRFTNQDVIDQIVDKRYYKEDEYGYQRNWSDDERNTRSGRSCKGKRYQAFMAVGGLIVNKRQKRDYSDKLEEGYGAACSWEAPVPDDIATPDTIPTEDVAEIEIKETDASETDNNQTKTFKAADFDLDAKIAALPSLSLEKFQQRKRENKRKKKTINLKPKVLGSSHIVNSVAYPAFARREMAEGWREQVIGSQKRKPRKISITRLEVARPAPVSVPAAPAPAAPVAPAPAPPPAELFALATLAEVASSAPYTDNASTVLNTN